MGTPVTPNHLGSTKKKGKYYNPKLYHALSVDTDIASGKRVNYRIPGGMRTGSDPWFLSPYNKQSSLSTNGRAIGEDRYGTMQQNSGVLFITMPNSSVVQGDIIDITITSGPNAGDSFHRTVQSNDGTAIGVIHGAADLNFGAVTKPDGSAWSWLGVSITPDTLHINYTCKVTF